MVSLDEAKRTEQFVVLLIKQILVRLQMGKKTSNKQSPTCSGRWCQTHLFSIRPIFVSLSNPKEDALRLCPKLNRDKKVYEKITPKLNLDKKFYTPNFILEEDQRLYIDHDRSNQRNFEHSKLSEEEEISQIMIPKVNSSSAYCRVCRQNYEDYLQHTTSLQHSQNVAKHPYSAFIVELVENFKTNGCKQTINQTSNFSCHFSKNNQVFMDQQIQSQLQEKQTSIRLKQNYNQKTIQ